MYHDLSPTFLAKQITEIEHNLLKRIDLDELNDASWAKEDSKSPNIASFIAFSNKLTYWIISEILKIDDPKERAQKISFFLNLGAELLKLQNYNGASVVCLSVRHPSIYRLKSTWQLVDKESQDIDGQLYDLFLFGLDVPEDNYNAYRSILPSLTPPFIPYMRLLLEEIADSCTDPLDKTVSTRHFKCAVQNSKIYGIRDIHSLDGGNVIIMHKSILKTATSADYNLNSNPDNTEKYILTYKSLSNDETYAISIKIEPRSSSSEPKSSSSSGWQAVCLGIGLLVIAFGAYWYVDKKRNKSQISQLPPPDILHLAKE